MKRVRGGETGCLAQGDVNIALLVCLGLLGLFAAACGGSSSGSPNTESHLSGTVEGGTSPISGSRVTLYEAGDSAYGRGAKSLGTAITDANGTFNITYVAPKVPTVLYLLAEGGNAGGGTNSAVKLAAVVGLSTQLPAAAVVNEFSTIGLEWALRQFSDSSGAMIGAPTTNASGFGNAVNALGTNLVDLARGAPGSLLAGIASTCGNTSPAVNCGGLEQMNTLANILAACVVTGTNSVQCATLLEKATPPGGLTPLDTLTAAADIARNPTNNVSSLFALQRGSSPYQPALT